MQSHYAKLLRAMLTASLLLVTSFAVPVAAGVLEDAGIAYNQRNFAEAVKLYRRAADQGYAEAQSFLGVLYKEGTAVAQDYFEAAKWFRRAADQGDSNGQFLLGSLYASGKGVPRDYVQAHVWFNLAAQQGDDSAKALRNFMEEVRLSTALIAEAQKLAREWKPKKER